MQNNAELRRKSNLSSQGSSHSSSFDQSYEFIPREENISQPKRDTIIKMVTTPYKHSSPFFRNQGNYTHSQIIEQTAEQIAEENLEFKPINSNQQNELKQKQRQINEKYAQLSEKEKSIQLKFKEIQQKEGLFIQKQTKNHRKQQQIQQKFNQIGNKELMLSKKQVYLNQLEQEITTKFTSITKREQSMSLKQKELQERQRLSTLRINENSNINTKFNQVSLKYNEMMAMHHTIELESAKKEEALKEELSRMQRMLQDQIDNNDLQRKANQVYSQIYTNLKRVCQDYFSQGINSIQNITERVSSIIKDNRQYKAASKDYQFNIQQLKQRLKKAQNQMSTQQNQKYSHEQSYYLRLISQKDDQIALLRQDLLLSSQNNINAIFNTEITEVSCLHHQIKKMNNQIDNLRSEIKRVQGTPNRGSQIIKIYTDRGSINVGQDSDGLFEQKESIYRKRRKEGDGFGQQPKRQERNLRQQQQIRFARDNKYLQNRQNIQEVRSVSKSRLGERADSVSGRQRATTSHKVQELLTAYQNIQEEYGLINKALTSISSTHGEFKHFLEQIKKELTHSLQIKMQEIMDKQGKGSAVEMKLNYLIDLLNAPERATKQKNQEDEQIQTHQSKRQIQQVQMHKVSNNFKGSSVILPHPNIPQAKIHNSHSSHSPSNKIASYQQQIGQKNQRIKQLQNTILDHLQGKISTAKSEVRFEAVNIQKPSNVYNYQYQNKSNHSNNKSNANQSNANKSDNGRYEMYISNLKVLLAESRKQNDILKKQLMYLSQSQLQMHEFEMKSIPSSRSTTKNQSPTNYSYPHSQFHPLSTFSQMNSQHMPHFQTVKQTLAIQELIVQTVGYLVQIAEKSARVLKQKVRAFLKVLVEEIRGNYARVNDELSNNADLTRRLFLLSI